MEARAGAARGGVTAALEERLGVSALRYPVPGHANTLGYTLGGITLVTFVLLVVTGIWLGQYYDPGTVEAAHTSVFYISAEAPLGSVIRSFHYWLATMFVITLVVHLIRTFATGSFKRPREATWLSGVLLLGLGAAALFTGTVLKADQEAVEALAHNDEIADFFGALGFWFSADFTDNVAPLTRLYIAHVSIVPLLILVLVGLHLMLVKRHGVSPLPWGEADVVAERDRREPRIAFSSHLRHIALWGLAAAGVGLVLSGLLPAALGPQGAEGIEITKPPWYFLWLYQPENWWGLDALWIGSAALFLALFAVPFLDRSAERDPRRRRLIVALGALVAVGWIALTIAGATAELAAHVGME